MRVKTKIDDPSVRRAAVGLCLFCGLTEDGEGDGALWIADEGGAESLLPLDAGDALIVLCREEGALARWETSATKRIAAVRMPWSIGEMLGRIRAFAAPTVCESPLPAKPARDAEVRSEAAREEAVLSEGDRSVTLGGETVRLTAREYAVLDVLLRHAGSPVSRDELLRQVWGKDPRDLANVADVTVGYLRRKLRPLFGDGAVVALRGRGYLWAGRVPILRRP